VTDARLAWVRAEDRKRRLLALGIVAAAYALLFLAFGIAALLQREELGDFSGPVVVRLGKPEGEDLRRAPDEPELPAPPEAQAPPSPQPPESPPSVVQPSAPAVPKPAPSAAPAAPKPAAPAQAAQPSPKPAPPQPVILRGSETGNTYDIAFEAGAGDVGRNFGPPIWLYMPLPFELSDAVYRAIPDYRGTNMGGTAAQRRAAFEKLYEKTSKGTWKLKGDKNPSYESRPELWAMLEDAAYPVDKAEYKEGKALRAVTILFKVSSYRADRGVLLEDIHIESSSGYSDIDEAVRYGFTRGEFRNSGAVSVNGRFTYRF
jgi:hypothetical protein